MIKKKDVARLIDALVEAEDGDYSQSSFEKIATRMTEKLNKKISGKYLTYELYKGKAKNPRISILDSIAVYLGYTGFYAFLKGDAVRTDPILQSMTGDYYCYIRMNRNNGQLLRSPVQICKTNGAIFYHLKGDRLEYKGNLTKAEGCLFVLMQSNDGQKSFYHVYRISNMKRPGVLQGIFSGVSTNFTPIGGRALLLRTDKPFDSLKTGKLDIKKLRQSKLLLERRVAEYFEHKSDNNITINAPSTFGPDDLGECH